MKKINLKLIVKSKLFWRSVIIILLITSTVFYILQARESALRISMQNALSKAVEEKRVLGSKLLETISGLDKELKARERQIRVTLDRLEEEITTRRNIEARLLMSLEENRILKSRVIRHVRSPKTIELERIVIVNVAAAFEGKILAVNKEYSFVVVDLGRADDIRLGDILSVYRDDNFVGSVKVEKVEDNVCTASILPSWKNEEFKEDDEVKKIPSEKKEG